MKVLLLSAVLAVNLGSAGDQSAPERSPTFGKPAESFVTDCELILFGREVPKVTENGKLGYRIVKRPDAVLVNGLVCVSASTTLPEPVFVDPQIEAASRVIQAAADYLWSNKEVRRGAIVVAGESHPVGVPFTLMLPEKEATVEVTILGGGAIWIEYGGQRVGYPAERPPTPLPEAMRIEERLDGAYRFMLDDLKPGRLVVKGGGYAYFFPLSRAAEVKASLAKIPARAKFEHFDVYGQAIYEPIQDGDFLWHSSIIREVMEQ